MAARAVAEALGVLWARLARARVASPLAEVLTTVEHLTADGVTRLLLAAASHLEGRLSAEAVELDAEFAGLAATLVAFGLTLMLKAVQQLATGLTARELGPVCVGAWHLLLLLPAVATDWDLDAARRAAAGMAHQIARRMGTVLVPLSLAVFAARVWQGHRVVGWLLVLAAVALVGRQ